MCVDFRSAAVHLYYPSQNTRTYRPLWSWSSPTWAFPTAGHTFLLTEEEERGFDEAFWSSYVMSLLTPWPVWRASPGWLLTSVHFSFHTHTVAPRSGLVAHRKRDLAETTCLRLPPPQRTLWSSDQYLTAKCGTTSWLHLRGTLIYLYPSWNPQLRPYSTNEAQKSKVHFILHVFDIVTPKCNAARGDVLRKAAGIKCWQAIAAILQIMLTVSTWRNHHVGPQNLRKVLAFWN